MDGLRRSRDSLLLGSWGRKDIISSCLGQAGLAGAGEGQRGHCEFWGGDSGRAPCPSWFSLQKEGRTLCEAWLHPQPRVTPQGGLAFTHNPVSTNITPSIREFGGVEGHLPSCQMRQLRHGEVKSQDRSPGAPGSEASAASTPSPLGSPIQVPSLCPWTVICCLPRGH